MYAVPTCGSPVGDGATRVRTGPEPSEVDTRSAGSVRTSTCSKDSGWGAPVAASGTGEDGILALVLLSLMVRPSLVGARKGQRRTKVLVSDPMPAISTVTCWPASTSPTPAGVPVRMTSPG